MRAFTEMWDRITRGALRRHRREAAPLPLRRAGELARAHRGAAREQRAAHRARDARRHAVEGRAGARGAAAGWNEALGLPRPWDQQWSLRIQQVLALRDRPARVRRPLRRLEGRRGQDRRAAPRPREAELRAGRSTAAASFAMIDDMKGRLVQSHAERVRRIESGDLTVVGVNTFTETAPSPLAGARERGRHRRRRPGGRARAGRARSRRGAPRATTPRSTARSTRLRAVAADDREPHARRRSRSPAPAAPSASGRGALREVFGEYRAPTGVGAVARPRPARRCRRCASGSGRDRRGSGGRPIRLLVGKPGPRRPLQRRRADRGGGPRRRHGGRLPGHPPHARRRSRPPPGTRTSTSSASRSCRARTSTLVPETIAAARARTGVDAPVVVGGIIPEADRRGAGGHGRGAGLHAEGLPPGRDHGRHRRAGPGSPETSPQAGADQPPMRTLHGGSATRRRRIAAAWRRSPRAPSASRRTRPRSQSWPASPVSSPRSPASPSRAEARRNGDQLGQAENEIRTMRRELAVDQRGPAGRVEPPRRRGRARPARRRAASATSRPSTRRPASTTSATSRCSCSSRSRPPAGRCARSRS